MKTKHLTERTRREMTISLEQARAIIARGVRLKGATLANTMGPYWRDIIWIQGSDARNRRCHVSDTHTFDQIKAILPAA